MPISRDDIQAKAMEIVGAVDDSTEAVRDKAIWGVAVVGLVILGAFVVGRRRGGRNKTIVEVYRV
jgi:hypothetical protein